MEFKAFSRSRQIKTPEQRLQVVLGYGGVDQVLRETAGYFTLLEERISDTAVKALAEELARDGGCPVLAQRLGVLADEFDIAGLRRLVVALDDLNSGDAGDAN